MSKLVGLAFTVMFLLPSANSVRESFAKYKAIEAYEIRPGILMMPRYSADGQACEIGLERRHYSSEMIRLDASLPRKEIDQIFDELVPANERGPLKSDLGSQHLSLYAGNSVTSFENYENVSINMFGKVSPTYDAGVVVAVIHWNHRTCQSE